MGSRREIAAALIDELWLLSLCLRNVLQEQLWDEAPAILEKRATVLSALEALNPDPEWIPGLEKSLEADRKVQELLVDLRRQLALDMEADQTRLQAGEAYAAAQLAESRLMDQDG